MCPGKGHVLDGLIELLAEQIDVIAFRTVDHALLQGAIQFSEGYRRGLSAQRIEAVDHDLAAHGADLEPRHVGWRQHRTLGVPQVAVAAVDPAEHEHIQAILDRSGDPASHRTINHSVEVIQILENEGKVKQIGLGKQSPICRHCR